MRHRSFPSKAAYDTQALRSAVDDRSSTSAPAAELGEIVLKDADAEAVNARNSGYTLTASGDGNNSNYLFT